MINNKTVLVQCLWEALGQRICLIRKEVRLRIKYKTVRNCLTEISNTKYTNGLWIFQRQLNIQIYNETILDFAMNFGDF